MSTHSNRDELDNGLSRRAFLGATGAALAALTGMGMSVEEALAVVSAQSRPVNGGQLLVALSNESPNMDPHQASDYITLMIIGGILLVALTAPGVVNGLRRGHFRSRGRPWRVDRRRQPVRFWTGIGAGLLFSLVGMLMLLEGLGRQIRWH